MPGGYVVRDANGQALAYLYSWDNPADARQAKVLTADEARRIAALFAAPKICNAFRIGWGFRSPGIFIEGAS
jgi:hypothetical protein